MSKELIMETRGAKDFNEQMQQFQHQFVCYKEKSNQRFQELEELVGLAAQKMEILRKMKAEKKRREVFKDLAHDALATYTGKPIYDEGPVYDENPGEDQECWPEQDFILAALGDGNSDSPYTLQSEICTSEKSVEFEDFSNLKDFDSLPYVCEQVRTFIMSKEDATKYLDNHQNQDAFCRNSPTVAESSGFGLDKKSSYLDRQTMTIFDPGGLVKKDYLQGVTVLFKDKEVSIINSAYGQLGHLQLKDLEQTKPELNKAIKPEYYEVSRTNATIYIYDPGGDSSCLHGILLGVFCWNSKIFSKLFSKMFSLEGAALERTSIHGRDLLDPGGRKCEEF